MTLTSIGPANRMARSAETHPLTWRLREDAQPVWLEEYQSKDGYAAARKALTQMAQDDIVQTVKDSGLKGRGGAGFPTGVKWGLMPKDESLNIRYLLCNADEMEPNTWKDRMLMEQLPHLLVEGMLISARAEGLPRLHLPARRIRRRGAQPQPRHRRSQGRRPARQEHPRQRLRFRAVRPHRCRPLHLRRRDRADQLAGRPPRQPAFQTALPCRRRRLGQADLREQRGDAVQRAGHRRQRRGLVQDPGPPRQRRHGHQADGLLRQGEEPRPVGTAVRRQRPRAVRGLRRRHARRLPAQGLAARRRRYRLPAPGAPGCADVRRRHRQGRHPDGHRPGHGGGRQHQHGFLLRNMEEFFARESCGWCTPAAMACRGA